ncbi:MAG TPA: WD40 repeat domain-containing protein [Candidatus Limnocylindrales bacterium]|nr:WD40 repeat domain-containing protein [Candidatus Limnocylindrales bacterium]
MATLATAVAGAAAGLVLLSACGGSCTSSVHQASIPALAAGGSDGVEIDQAGHKLFFADRATGGVDVVDLSAAPRFVGTIGLPAPANGLAFAPNLKRLYAGLYGGTVAVIDADGTSPNYMKVIDSVTVDTAVADLLDFSPRTQSLYVGTGSSNAVVVVDAVTDTVTHRFDVKAAVEQPRFNPADGRIYVTAPTLDSLLQLDASTGTVTRSYMQLGCRPSGLAINPGRQLAMVGCRSSIATFSLRTGLDEISTSVAGGDIITYDPRVDRFTVGSSHGPRDSSVGVYAGDGRFVAQVPSSPGAHGAVFDHASGAVYAVGVVGLLYFTPADCAPPPGWLIFAGGLAIYLAPIGALAMLLILYARRMSRRDPSERRPTRDELAREDLIATRERIRAIEDAIFGPEGSG